MTCGECGFEQDRGRYCGRCGAPFGGASAPDTSADVTDPVDTPSTASTTPSTTMSPSATTPRWMLAVVLTVAVAIVVGWVFGPRLDDGPADELRATPGDDGRAPAPEGPPDSSAAPDPGAPPEPSTPEAQEEEEPATPEEPGGSLGGFRRPTGTVLLFDDGAEGALALHLDTGERERVALPGQRAGDQPFRLWPLGSSVVVGREEIWAVPPAAPESARRLGEATVFLPHADPDALWLIDYEGGRVGTGASTWTLFDPSSAEMAQVVSAPAGLIPVRGVPGGLVVGSPDGTQLVYDLEQDALVGNPVGGSARVADVIADRVAWCEGDPCERLRITDAGGEVAATIEAAETFEPGGVWFSPDGDLLAAAARVPVGEAIDHRLRIYSVADSEVLADTQLTLGSVFGDWTGDGRQFFSWNHFPDHAGAPATLRRWSGGSEIEAIEVDEHGIRDVYDFVALPSRGLEAMFQPEHADRERS